MKTQVDSGRPAAAGGDALGYPGDCAERSAPEGPVDCPVACPVACPAEFPADCSAALASPIDQHRDGSIAGLRCGSVQQQPRRDAGRRDRLPDGGQRRRRRDHPADFGMSEDISGIADSVFGIDRHHHGPEPSQGDQQEHRRRMIERHAADAIAGCDAEPGELRRDPVDCRLHVAVVDAPLAVDQAFVAGRSRSAAVEQRTQRFRMGRITPQHVER